MIETKRLLFRPWKEADAEELFRLASDPDVGPRAGWPPHKSVEESLEIINTVFNSDHVWALVLKDVGWCCRTWLVSGRRKTCGGDLFI